MVCNDSNKCKHRSFSMIVSYATLKIFLPGVRDLLVSQWNLLLEEIGWMESDDSLSQGEEIPSDQELGKAFFMYGVPYILRNEW